MNWTWCLCIVSYLWIDFHVLSVFLVGGGHWWTAFHSFLCHNPFAFHFCRGLYVVYIVTDLYLRSCWEPHVRFKTCSIEFCSFVNKSYYYCYYYYVARELPNIWNAWELIKLMSKTSGDCILWEGLTCHWHPDS